MRVFWPRVVLSLAIIATYHASLALAGDVFPCLAAIEGQPSVVSTADQSSASVATTAYFVENQGEADGWAWTTAAEQPIDAAMQPASRFWSIDYRVMTMFDSHTTYEFGTIPGAPGPQYAPLSRLDWSLDSTWHGLQVGVESPNWRAHVQWLTPMIKGGYRDMSDFDWSGPDRDPALLSVSPQRWTDGQMLELEASRKVADTIFSVPIEIWPAAGFRFQRLDMMAYNGVQVINDGTFGPNPPPVGYRWSEDMISLNQQYYMGYVGGELRTMLVFANMQPIVVTFEGDWATVAGYNVDHHISGYEADGIHRYTMESTFGDAYHLALVGESLLSPHFSVGLRVEHLAIRTTGTHRWTMSGATTPVNETWSNGVAAWSDQSSITAFFRARF
jgi:hypothetical protein